MISALYDVLPFSRKMDSPSRLKPSRGSKSWCRAAIWRDQPALGSGRALGHPAPTRCCHRSSSPSAGREEHRRLSPDSVSQSFIFSSYVTDRRCWCCLIRYLIRGLVFVFSSDGAFGSLRDLRLCRLHRVLGQPGSTTCGPQNRRFSGSIPNVSPAKWRHLSHLFANCYFVAYWTFYFWNSDGLLHFSFILSPYLTFSFLLFGIKSCSWPFMSLLCANSILVPTKSPLLMLTLNTF